MIDIPIVHTLYETYRQWHTLVIKFPKIERHALGALCANYLLGIMEAVLAAGGVSKPELKIDHLRRASVKLDALRLLVRLAKDCNCILNQDYLQIESKLLEAGRMLGGWMRSIG